MNSEIKRDVELIPCYCSDNECFFEADDFITLLLIEGYLFTNSYWFMKEWVDSARKKTALFVTCNDIFLWGCADGEEIDYEEFDTLYQYYTKDKIWGVAVWVIKKRNLMPQKPVYDKIKKDGIWDLDKMNLNPNKSWR